MRETFKAANESYNLIFAQEGGLGNMIYLSIPNDERYISYVLPVLWRRLHVVSPKDAMCFSLSNNVI